MDITELVQRKRDELAAAKARRKAALDAVQARIDQAKAERRDFTPAERRDTDAQMAYIRDASLTEINNAQQALADAEQLEAEERQASAMANQTSPTSVPTGRIGTASTSVTRNEDVYRPDQDPRGQQFARDVIMAQVFRDSSANQKLAMHQNQMMERVGTGVTGDFDGLVIPAYLTNLAAHKVSAKRNFADLAMTHLPLPAEGMTIELSKAKTASSAAEQAAELDAVSTTQMEDDPLSIKVRTYAGAQVMSQQAAQRGRIEPFVMEDIQMRMAEALEDGVLNTALVGAIAVANDTPSAAADAGDLYDEILAAAGRVETTLSLPADSVAMDSTTWAWLAAFRSAERPLFEAPVRNDNAPYDGRVRGVLPGGARIVVSNKIPLVAGKHQVLVLPSVEAYLWEGQNSLIRSEQVDAAHLAVQLVAYQFAAFTLERYADVVESISGITIP